MFQIIYPIKEIAVVIATTYVNPISFLQRIEAKLKSQEFQGDIYIDLLLVNANAFNRFIFCHLYEKIDRSTMSIRPLGMIPSIVLDGIINFHQTFPEFLESSQIIEEPEKMQILSSKS